MSNNDEFNEVGFYYHEGNETLTVDGKSISSMMSSAEATFLYHCSKNLYSAEGVIIDLGPYLGLSTYALARGLTNNPCIELLSKHYIFSFDLFEYYEWFENYISITGSIFMQWYNNTNTFRPYIHVSPGNILNMSWNGGKIEVLFIDICKSWDINNHVVKTFFPHIIPSKSIIIQQDYGYFGHEWIHITMELLSEYFEILEDYMPNGSRVYRCVKAIPDHILEDFDPRNIYSIDELIYMHKNICDKSTIDLRGIMKLAHAKFLLDSNLITKSVELYNSITENDFTTKESYRYFILNYRFWVNDISVWLDSMEQKSKIVIYGAGAMGRNVKKHIEKHSKHIISIWCDINYMNISNNEVVSPEVLRNADFDVVCIAITDSDVVADVTDYLISLGVKQSKIHNFK